METFKYKKISPYPYVVRDISLYVPENINENEIIRVIKKEEGKNLCNLSDPRLIDSFIKKMPNGTTKKSFSFRIVFQAQDRTLTRGEIDETMERIFKSLSNMNCEIR